MVAIEDRLDNQVLTINRINDLVSALEQRIEPTPICGGEGGAETAKPNLTMAYLADVAGNNAEILYHLANRLEGIYNRL